MFRSLAVGSCFLAAFYFSACDDSTAPRDEAQGGRSSTEAGAAGEAGSSSDAGGASGSGAAGAADSAGGGEPDAGASGSSGAGGEGASSDAGGNAGSGGSADADARAGAGGEAPVCEPTTPSDEVCDDVDNDCNGEVDDIDVGGDGIRDCLDILLIGGPGANASSNFQTWLSEQGAQVSRIHTGDAPELVSSDFDGFDVVILDNLARAYSEEESAVLGDWVRSGGGIVSLNGHTGSSDLSRGNSLLLALGVEHLPGLKSSNVTEFRDHPLTTGLSSITFQGGYLVGDLPEGEGSVVVAELPDGPVGLALDRDAGRAYVWGDEWVEFDSEWQTLPEIKQFWVNALGWVSHAL